jgi:hypothetical protein
MLRQADRARVKRFLQGDRAIAESEGDHAASRNIAELIGRTKVRIEIECTVRQTGLWSPNRSGYSKQHLQKAGANEMAAFTPRNAPPRLAVTAIGYFPQ